MRCPFLREAQVKYCQASPFKKMIVRSPEHTASERCSSPDWAQCPSAKQHHEEQPNPARCPFLQESLVQYCSAASVTKFVPYSDSMLSRCCNDGHRYCDLFLTLANPPATGVAAGAAPDEGSTGREIMIEGTRVPAWLSYSANHMWLNIDEDGCCHVGLDAFLMRVLGSVDKLTFVTIKGLARPAVVITVRGADLQMVFPNPMLLTRTNNYLRANPFKLALDPYGVGWLFEGAPAPDDRADLSGVGRGLMRGASVLTWMQEEIRRITAFIHEQLARTSLPGDVLLPDGGSFAPGFVRQLSRDEILRLFNEFFSPYVRR